MKVYLKLDCYTLFLKYKNIKQKKYKKIKLNKNITLLKIKFNNSHIK